jgi:hypothetical protein
MSKGTGKEDQKENDEKQTKDQVFHYWTDKEEKMLVET